MEHSEARNVYFLPAFHLKRFQSMRLFGWTSSLQINVRVHFAVASLKSSLYVRIHLIIKGTMNNVCSGEQEWFMCFFVNPDDRHSLRVKTFQITIQVTTGITWQMLFCYIVITYMPFQVTFHLYFSWKPRVGQMGQTLAWWGWGSICERIARVLLLFPESSWQLLSSGIVEGKCDLSGPPRCSKKQHHMTTSIHPPCHMPHNATWDTKDITRSRVGRPQSLSAWTSALTTPSVWHTGELSCKPAQLLHSVLGVG